MMPGGAGDCSWPGDEAVLDVDDQVMTGEEFAAYGAELARKCGKTAGGSTLASGRSSKDPDEPGTARKLVGAELARLCAADVEGQLSAAGQARLDERYAVLAAELEARTGASLRRGRSEEEQERA
jgi:hypothetical protein